MTRLFQNLERICNALIFSANYKTHPVDFTDSLQHETAAIKKQLKDLFFNRFCPNTFENIINLHDSLLTELLDKLTTHLDIERTRAALTSPEENSAVENILSAYHHITELLDFIHTHFNSFISRHRRMTKYHGDKALQDLKDAKSFIEEQIPAEINPQLKDFLCRPFNTFIRSKTRRTWHMFYYCQHIYAGFRQLADDSCLLEEDIIWMLGKLNYNSSSFYAFITEHIQKQNYENYLEYLYTLQCKVRQTVVPAQLALEVNEPSLNKLLENWLREEINYLKNISALRGKWHSENSKPKSMVNDKTLANLSVAELAYLFKILAETNVLTVSNHTEFFQSLTRTYRTKNSDNISSNSIKAKFYKPEPGVKDTIKRHLLKLVNHINLHK